VLWGQEENLLRKRKEKRSHMGKGELKFGGENRVSIGLRCAPEGGKEKKSTCSKKESAEQEGPCPKRILFSRDVVDGGEKRKPFY